MEVSRYDCLGKTLLACPAFTPFSPGFGSIQTFRERGSTALAPGNSVVQGIHLKLCLRIHLLVGEQPNLGSISQSN